MDSTKYPTPHPQVAARVVDGSALIVLADSGEVNVLNPVGTRMWELMDGTRTVQEIADTICDEYDVTAQQSLADVEELVSQLMGANALVLQDQPAQRG